MEGEAGRKGRCGKLMLCQEQSRHRASGTGLGTFKRRQLWKHKEQKLLLSWKAGGEGRPGVPQGCASAFGG